MSLPSDILSSVPVADWTGKTGEQWVQYQDQLDQMLSPFGLEALKGLDAHQGQYCVDIGCGAGTTTRILEKLVAPKGRVLGVDISSALIAQARRLTLESSCADYLLADAADAAIPPHSFDRLYSRFGMMFFDAPLTAFENLRHLLKPRGRMSFVCWRSAAENEWASLPLAAVTDLLPPPVSDPQLPRLYEPGPFSFADAAWLCMVLQEAEYRDISIRAFDAPVLLGSGQTDEDAVEAALLMVQDIGPLARLLADQPAEKSDIILNRVRESFKARVSQGRLSLAGAAWIVTAGA